MDIRRKALNSAMHLFYHVHLGWAALNGAMIIYCRLAEDHGVPEHMIIGDTKPPAQVWH